MNKSNVSFRVSMTKLIKYLKPYYFWLVVALLFAIVGTVFSIIGPNKIGDMTTIIEQGVISGVGIDLDEICRIGIILVILYLISAVLSYLQGYIMTDVIQKSSKKMRNEIYAKTSRLPLKYYDTHTFGDTLSRITNDVDTIGLNFNQAIVMLLSGGTLIIGSLVMMFVTAWQLALVALVCIPIGMGLLSLLLKFSQKYFFSQQSQIGELNGIVEETYSGHNVVKVYNAQEKMKNKFERTNKKLYQSQYKSQFVSGVMMPVMNFVGNLGYVAVCVVGGILYLNNHIEFGAIISFIIYIKLFTQPLSTIAQSISSLQSVSAASSRVFEFLEESEMPKEQATLVLDNVVGDVKFENVKFGYNKDKLIINGLTAHAHAGQKIALVAPTGAGKTTLVNLLMKFYEIDDGDIKIDDVSIKDLTRENVHNLFSMVLQDSWQFDGTILDNIIFNTPNATKEDAIDACKKVGLHHFIMTLSNGYETILDDTVSLSAGQKQLVTIARAMVRNAPLLILDEATSSVDTRTELIIAKAMDELTKDKTSFVIAHRLSTIKNADQIWIMRNGAIVESGTHDELLKLNGIYAELYNSQF